MRTARAPGRVNLIGDHTDYAGGAALAMAIDLETTARLEPDETSTLEVASDAIAEVLTLAEGGPPTSMTGRMIEGLLGLIGHVGGRLDITTTIPLGAGLSSSASLLVAAALALGTSKRGLDLAHLCQAAEAEAGQSVGLLDQLTIIEATDGHGVLIDFATMSTTQVAIPASAEITVVHSGVQRSLAAGAYGERRREVAQAEALIGPLATAGPAQIDSIDDATIRRRASHVARETTRVRQAARALEDGELEVVGKLMDESHVSLSELFEVSLPAVDELVADLRSRAGVYGARMTGGGFGGCVVVLSRPGALLDATITTPMWRVRPCGGASLLG